MGIAHWSRSLDRKASFYYVMERIIWISLGNLEENVGYHLLFIAYYLPSFHMHGMHIRLKGHIRNKVPILVKYFLNIRRAYIWSFYQVLLCLPRELFDDLKKKDTV